MNFGQGLKGRKAACLDFCMGAALGAVVFLLLYGVATLDVTYDSWIFAGYVEEDILQRYAGWLYFRNAPWDWPITVAGNLAVPYGTSIVFTDSIPLVSVFFKLFQPILPATFQFFGWYNLFNCMMQGGFALLLLRHFKLSRGAAAIGGLFFLFAPIFIERMFRHDGLASQFIILAALLFYFKARHEEAFPAIGFWVLCVLSLTIHTYFLPMVYALLGAALLERSIKTKKIGKPIGLFLLCLGSTFVTAYVFGLVTRGGGGGASGFGQYSMNLNALINPASLDMYGQTGRIEWSAFLQGMPQNHYQYDGFNYLGLGLLAGMIMMLAHGCFLAAWGILQKNFTVFHQAVGYVKRHIWILLACICLTLLAISNVVVWGETTLFTLPLPEKIFQLASIFRASGRLFWPCWYLILLAVILFCNRMAKGRGKILLLSLLLILQLWDVSPALTTKFTYFRKGPIVAQTEFATEDWQFFASHYQRVDSLNRLFDYQLAASFIRYNPNVETNLLLANRGEFTLIEESYAPLIEELRSGAPIEDGVLYICKDRDTFTYILEGLHPEGAGYQLGEYYFIANPLEGCPVKEVQRQGM